MSHSGACRFCDEADVSVPDFYLGKYNGAELRPPTSTAVRHAETGNSAYLNISINKLELDSV